MAWNWRPSPLELKMKDARSIAASNAMQGYVPAEADPSKYVATPQVLAQEQMQGYTPALAGYSLPDTPVQPQPLQGGVRLPADAARELGKGWIYTQQQEQAAQQREALLAEYQRNEARIAEIERQIKTTGGTFDELDMNLAANRAGIGDIGNAQMHLGRIESRKNSERERAINGDKNKAAARKELNNAYIMMAEASPAARNAWKAAIDDMATEYENTYGEKFTPVEIPMGSTGSSARATNKQEFTDKMRNLRNEKGNLTDEGMANLQADIDAMPKGDMRNECQTLLDAEKSQEKKDAGAAAERAKEKAAIEEASKKFSGWNMKNGDSKTYTADNGKTVTYTKVNGKLEFTCGKSKG